MTTQKDLKGYKTIPYLYDYKSRGIPLSKPVRVIPMKHLPTCTCPTCKKKRERK